MSFKTLLNLLLLGVCLISSVIIIKINSQDPQPTPQPHPQPPSLTFPLEKILSSEEIKLIESGKNILLTPLEYERIVNLAWLSGLSDMKKQLARNLTETGKTIDYNFVKKMNEENSMILPVKQIEYQFIHAYVLGNLNSVNRVLREGGIEIPRMKLASDEDVKKMYEMYPNLMKMFEKSQVEQKQYKSKEGTMMQTMTELNENSKINENDNSNDNKLSDSEMETAQFFFGSPFYGGFGYRPWGFGYGFGYPWGFGGGYGFGYRPWGFGWRRFWW